MAIARALAAEPDVLLNDEPLSALDLKLRQHMRTELRSIRQRVGITFIYITHDQNQVLAMSDHDASMVFVRPESMRILQAGNHGDNEVNGTVVRQEFEGNLWQVHVKLENDGPMVSVSAINDGRASAHAIGAAVRLGFDTRQAVALPPGQVAAE